MKDTLNTIQTLETGISSRGTIRTFRSLVDITVGSELCQTLLSKNYGDMSPQVVVQDTFRDCCCQRGLAMIDVPNCSDIAMGLVSLESFRKGARNRTFQLGFHPSVRNLRQITGMAEVLRRNKPRTTHCEKTFDICGGNM